MCSPQQFHSFSDASGMPLFSDASVMQASRSPVAYGGPEYKRARNSACDTL